MTGLGASPDIDDRIREAEGRIDSALWGLEVQDKVPEALEGYQTAAAARKLQAEYLARVEEETEQ